LIAACVDEDAEAIANASSILARLRLFAKPYLFHLSFTFVLWIVQFVLHLFNCSRMVVGGVRTVHQQEFPNLLKKATFGFIDARTPGSRIPTCQFLHIGRSNLLHDGLGRLGNDPNLHLCR